MLVAAALTVLAAAPPAAAERLVATLDRRSVLITASFTGAELVLFGTVERDDEETARRGGYDIVVTVRGPPESLVVRRKERAVGIWANTGSRTFLAVPSYVATLATRPLDQFVGDELAWRLHLGLRRTLLPQQVGADTADVVETDPFRRAFLRLKQSRGLYVEETNAVRFRTASLYSTTIALPAGAPVGTYAVDVRLFAGGEAIGSATETFSVAKFGFEEFVAESAVNHGLLYGLATAMMALVTGWLASVVFRRD
jgi:uncharacterized protein (TIGR02186 family)